MTRTVRLMTAAACLVTLAAFDGAPAFAQSAASTSAKADAKNDKKSEPLTVVTHDGTLAGDGTAAAPLTISNSPTVPGSLTVIGDITSRSLAVTGGISIEGASRAATTTGNAVEAVGGASDRFPGSGFSGFGGAGLGNADGGSGITGTGGDGAAIGGVGVTGIGGRGIEASGNGVIGFGGFPGGFGVIGIGAGDDHQGGGGVNANGGPSGFGNGGNGLTAFGGAGDGAGHKGGIGVAATGGIGENGAAHGLAGLFDGDVVVTGNLVKSSGAFTIDHPLDPANRYLSHSFVESPDMLNIYNGNVVTDAHGYAVVELPEYFNALNGEFRYQLTAIGTFAQAIIAEKIAGNHFRIRTSKPGVEVSWQVTGVRHDAFANAHRIAVDEEKANGERGLYLHPELFGQPDAKSLLAPQLTPVSAAGSKQQ